VVRFEAEDPEAGVEDRVLVRTWSRQRTRMGSVRLRGGSASTRRVVEELVAMSRISHCVRGQ
jgi:hypothetical protein